VAWLETRSANRVGRYVPAPAVTVEDCGGMVSPPPVYSFAVSTGTTGVVTPMGRDFALKGGDMRISGI